MGPTHKTFTPVLALRAAAFGLASFTLLGAGYAHAQDSQASYASAEEAVTALIEAVRSDDPVEAIVEVLGPDGEDIASTGDPVADEDRRERFLAAFEESHSIEQEEDGAATLVVGNDEFPFPIPIVSAEGKWRWDTETGLDEILSRWIGENELSTIEVMGAFVAAQLEYAERERVAGAGIQYARRLLSRDGKKDGLYWPAAEGEDESPMGPLIAQAQREGYKLKTGEDQRAYHGYVYRMLYGQGSHAEGGAMDFIVQDRMIGGFGLIATPAEYGISGVMTFIVNQDGVVFEKDLGPESAAEAKRIKLFDPDDTWQKVSTSE